MSRVGPATRGDVDEAEALEDLAVGRVVAVAEQLEAGADREHDGAAARARARSQRATPACRRRPSPAGRPRRRRRGTRRASRGSAPPASTSTSSAGMPRHRQRCDEHDRVAAVAVGAEQLRVDEPDPHRRRRACVTATVPKCRYSAENCVYDAMMCTSSPGSARAAASGSGSTIALDVRVPQPHRDVEATLARRRDRVAAQQLVRHVPEPRRVLAVGDARVDRDRTTAPVASARDSAAPRSSPPGSSRAARVASRPSPSGTA